MIVLDFLQAWVDRLLSWLPDSVVHVIGLPVFCLAFAVALVLAIRKGLPAIAGPLAALGSSIIAVLAVPFLALAMAAATPFRLVRLRPPEVVYGIDDGTVACTAALLSALRWSRDQANRLTKFPVVVLLIIAAILIWRWNSTHCSADASGCVTPVAQWARSLGE
jgi:hypothetical protein